MRFEIDHLTLYRYSVPVQLGEHLLRFDPRIDDRQQVERCDLETEPRPVHVEQGVDTWGNRIRRIRFEGWTDRLAIRAHIAAHTLEAAPLRAGNPVALPPGYGPDTPVPGPYLQPLETPERLHAFLTPLLATPGGATGFLDALNRAVQCLYHSGVRLDGPPRSPAETLARGEGVCRDLALLFMAACRQVGLAARFVSGYQQGDGTREQRYLHAWPEVCLPGLGWCGYDPTHGTTAGGDHLAVAAAPDAAGANPLEGGYSFQGERITSTLETEIRITTR